MRNEKTKFINLAVSLLVITSMFLGPNSAAIAMPDSPTDEANVPHYFGPNPNWALSPLTTPDIAVAITGDGSGATAVASVDASGAVTGVSVTNPGSGYTSATVDFTSMIGAGAAAVANVATSGAVTTINVDLGGSNYTAPSVTLSGGGGTGTLVQVGNPLIERAYATDNASNVMVVVPTALPAGTLQSIITLNQALPGGSIAPSAGLFFNAYVLRPTGVANQYSVVFDSGQIQVPQLADPAISEVITIPVTPTSVLAGDVLAFYGQGIPLDIGAGADILSYPAPSAPVLNGTIDLGSGNFPLLAQAREYSIAANVIDTSAVVPLTSATATAYGGVDAITITAGGGGYTMPTVDFDLPDAPDGVIAKAHAEIDANGVITAVVVDDPGSGYLAPPNVVIRNGTVYDPIRDTGFGATATATLTINSIVVDSPGAGYVSAPSVTINDATGTGASATAQVNAGIITSIDVTNPGSGYLSTGIKKFTDPLPGLCNPAVAGSCPAFLSRRTGPSTYPIAAEVHPAGSARSYRLQRHPGRPIRDRCGAVPHKLLVIPEGCDGRSRGNVGARLCANTNPGPRGCRCQSRLPAV